MSVQQYKVVILGEGQVGKTSILKRYFKNKFLENEERTTNPSFYTKEIDKGSKKYKFCFWDTAGQERYKALNQVYYNGSIGALIVYDISNFETFKKAKNWIEELKEMVGKDIVFVIVGNKFDKIDYSNRDEFKTNKTEVDQYAKQFGLKHFFTSAKNGDYIEDTFNALIEDIINKDNNDVNKKPMSKRGIKIQEEVQKEEKKEGCC